MNPNPVANTPEPPYYAVIFTSLRRDTEDGYGDTAEKMVRLAGGQPGFLGVESVREQNGCGITVSYWESLEAIDRWKHHPEHAKARQKGREEWYSSYKVRVCKVERDYGWEKQNLTRSKFYSII